MTQTEEIVSWLRAQLNEDERAARQDPRLSDDCGDLDDQDFRDLQRHLGAQLHTVDCAATIDTEGCRCHGPARMLAEVDAKRRIVTAIYDRKTWRDQPPAEWIDLDIESRVLELLAMPYAGRDGYRESWRP